MGPRKKQKVAQPVASASAPTREQIDDLRQLVANATDDSNYTDLSTYLKSTVTSGMSFDISIAHNEESLPLPMYLASTNRFALLHRLLADNVITFPCNVTAEDMWECMNVTKANIPHMCAVMEHFGADLRGPSAVDIVQWIESNRMLIRPLTHALSITPSPYPHLARAVVEVTPINSQAVTIAAKQGFVDWIDREAGRLSDTRPEGYSNWRSLLNHLRSEGAPDSSLAAVGTIAILSEQEVTRKEPAVAQAQFQAAMEMFDINADIASACANLERVGDRLRERAYRYQLASWLDVLSEASWTALVAELCTDEYPTTARAVIEACIETGDAREPEYCEFVRVIGHYGFADLIRAFVQMNDLTKHLAVPVYVPSSPHRLSEDDTVNAWLWLIKGDGDIDDKVWEVIKKSRLLKMRENDVDYYDVDGYIDLVVGAYRSGAKVTAKELIHTMNYKENADYLLLHEASYGSDLEALKCLVEAGADVYAVDSDGNTCLHMTDNDDIIKYIVEECYRRTLS